MSSDDQIGKWRITPKFLATWLALLTIYQFHWQTLILLCFVWAAIVVADCAQKEPAVGNDKLIWVLIILFIPFFGPTYYWFFRRPYRNPQ